MAKAKRTPTARNRDAEDVFPDVDKWPFVKKGSTAHGDTPVDSWWHVTPQYQWEADLKTGEAYAALALPELRRVRGVDVLGYITHAMIVGRQCSGVEIGFMNAVGRELQGAAQ